MYKIISILILSFAFKLSLNAADFSAQELGEKLYAVHATDIFPSDGVAYAGYGLEEDLPDNFRNYFRSTLHFAVGELVRPLGDDWMSWEEKKYAIVTPLKNLFPQLVNLNCYDTFIVGDFAFDEETILVAPKGTNRENTSFLLYEYDEHTSLREAVDALIALKGGWKVTMLGEDLEDEYPPAMIGEININTHEHFQPFLDLLPHLSLGLRWEPHHGEAWRFAPTEILLMGLYDSIYGDSRELTIAEFQYCREQLMENYEVFSKTYLEASLLDDSSKEVLLEKLNVMGQWLQLIDHELKERETQAA